MRQSLLPSAARIRAPAGEAMSCGAGHTPRPHALRAPQDDGTGLTAVAQRLSRWGLGAPVIFFLELHRPLSFAASQLAIFFQPMLGFFIGDENVLRFSRWLSEEDGLDQLINCLESGE